MQLMGSINMHNKHLRTRIDQFALFWEFPRFWKNCFFRLLKHRTPVEHLLARSVGDDINQNTGQVRLGGSVRNYFQYVQFSIRLAAVSYSGKNVGTVVSYTLGREYRVIR